MKRNLTARALFIALRAWRMARTNGVRTVEARLAATIERLLTRERNVRSRAAVADVR